MSRPCSVPGCTEPHKSKGYCGAHAERLRKYGDLMVEKPVRRNGEPMAFLLASLASDTDECIIWPFARNSEGYPQVSAGGRVVYAHRYACEMKHGPAPTSAHEAAHECGLGHLGCINHKHLRWATHSENLMDRLAHGTHNRGVAHPLAKLTVAKVREIRALRGVKTQREIAAIYGIDDVTVHSVQVGKTWGWLDAG